MPTADPQRILILQTAFIGDVILATALIEKLKDRYPNAQVDFLLRKGNESLLANHPKVNRVLIWDKQHHKYRNLWAMVREVRKQRYDLLVAVQRFWSAGFVAALSGAKTTVGFQKNPLASFFSKRVAHRVEKGIHETHRNHDLIAPYTDDEPAKPRLYPSPAQHQKIAPLKSGPYVCLAPTSVWFTKQYPIEHWVTLINSLHPNWTIYLLGAPGDRDALQALSQRTKHTGVKNLAGELSLLESAALMADARLNLVNDSAPLHLASAMNAPVLAFFCSTIPEFGFYPLSDKWWVAQSPEQLDCRPCGLHGFKACPKGHFNCAHTIPVQQWADLTNAQLPATHA